MEGLWRHEFREGIAFNEMERRKTKIVANCRVNVCCRPDALDCNYRMSPGAFLTHRRIEVT